MSIRRANSPHLAPWVGNSHAVGAGGFIYIAGQVGSDLQGNIPAELDAELAQIYANLELACAAAGASLADMVKTVTYTTDPAALPALREARSKRYGDGPPANSTVIVAGLTNPNAVAEIEGIAFIDRTGA